MTTELFDLSQKSKDLFSLLFKVMDFRDLLIWLLVSKQCNALVVNEIKNRELILEEKINSEGYTFERRILIPGSRPSHGSERVTFWYFGKRCAQKQRNTVFFRRENCRLWDDHKNIVDGKCTRCQLFRGAVKLIPANE